MKATIVAIGMILATCKFSHAENVTAQCSLDVDGRNVWNGKCCVETSAIDDGSTGFLVTLYAGSWRGCVYNRKHPENESRPTSQTICFTPWISIYEENFDTGTGKTLHAYWSLGKGSCHGEVLDVSAVKTGEGKYHGDNFRFTWKPIH